MLIKSLCLKNFETLADELLKPPELEKKLPKVVKEALKHGKLHEFTVKLDKITPSFCNLC